jgi:iron complex transport system ATP-binding protein
LEVRDVRFGYANRPNFLGPISLTIARGQCWAIVGPNGAGKSTLIRLIAGLLSPRDGSLNFRGQSMSAMSLRDRARHIGFLPQRTPESLDFTVRDVVLMGRYPHRSMGLFESADDHRIVDEAMRRTGVIEFADRSLAALSGGEAQRVHLAAVLAQDPELLLLDEPTASLDIKHQIAVFEILRGVLKPDGPAVAVVTHDVNLAAMFCSHVLLMHEGRSVAAGAPSEVLTAERLRSVYEVELAALPLSQPPHQWLVPQPGTEMGHT